MEGRKFTIKKKQDFLLGVIFAIVGIIYLFGALQLPYKGVDALGAGFLPKIIGVLAIVCGVILAGINLGRVPTREESPAERQEQENIQKQTEEARKESEEAQKEPKDIRKGAEVVQEELALKTDYRRVLLSLVLLAASIFLLEYVGFLIIGAVYLFLQILILSPKEKRKPIRYALLSIVISAAVYLLFVRAFHVMLPNGILKGIL